MIDKTDRPFFRERKPGAAPKGKPRSASGAVKIEAGKARPAKTDSAKSFTKSGAGKPDAAKPRFKAKDAGARPQRYPAGQSGGKRVLRRPQKSAQPVPTAPREDDAAGMRIAKVMARAGLCSRRDAEVWIEEGRVSVNGEVLTSPALNVHSSDEVSVDGVALAPRERTRLFLFHKPRGLVTTDKDPEGRETIFDFLRQHWPDGPRVISIGRLDINTEGLLLLTNDGGLARVLELPTTGWTRRYRVRANGKTDQAVLDRLRAGVTVDGIDYAGIEATLDRVQGDNVWLSLSLREGKNREIKRVLENIGLFVNRLIRVSFGPFQLGELGEGAVEEVRTRVLRDQLGPALEEEADADFDSPIADQQPVAVVEQPRGRRKAEPEPRPRGKEPRRGRERERERQERPERPDTRKISPSRAGKLARDARSGGREERREAPAPVEPSFKPRGPRKHISAMRDVEAPAKGDRKKAFRSETADRKGRAVVVERIAPALQRRETRQEERKDDRRDEWQENSRTAASRGRRDEAAPRQRREEAAERPRGRRDERDERPRAAKTAISGRFAGEDRKPGKPRTAPAFKGASRSPADKAPASRGPAKRPDGTDARKPFSQRSSRPDKPGRGEKPARAERPPRGGKPGGGDRPRQGGRPAAAKSSRPPRKH